MLYTDASFKYVPSKYCNLNNREPMHLLTIYIPLVYGSDTISHKGRRKI